MNRSLGSLVIALALAYVAPAWAGPGHDHTQEVSTKITGPNKGRVITELEPHAEFFVTPERKVRLTFIDDAGKPLNRPVGLMVRLVTGERSKPTTLEFSPESDSATAALLSREALPDGSNLPAILRITTTDGAKPLTIRFQINLANCSECSRSEYACACVH